MKIQNNPIWNGFSIETECTNFTSEQREPQQQAFDFENMEDMILTPETMKQMMDAQNMSIRQTAEEIVIAHTTLSLYLLKENKRQIKNNDEKMLNWLKEKAIERKTLTTILVLEFFFLIQP
jgi:hypothetical protein